jgi:hypothetical protein
MYYFSFMTTIIPVSDFRNNISEYINRVLYEKETFFVRKGKSSRLVKISLEDNGQKSDLDQILALGDSWTPEEAEDFEMVVKDARKKQESASHKRMKKLLQQLV